MSASKRRNDRAQQRREEYEAEEGPGEEAGSWTRASEAVLAKRKIVSVSSRFQQQQQQQAPKAQNPFASIALAPTPQPTVDHDAKKLEACRRDFVKWLATQKGRAPASSWRRGVEDFVDLVAPLQKTTHTKPKKPFAAAPGSLFGADKPLSFGTKKATTTTNERTEKKDDDDLHAVKPKPKDNAEDRPVAPPSSFFPSSSSSSNGKQPISAAAPSPFSFAATKNPFSFGGGASTTTTSPFTFGPPPSSSLQAKNDQNQDDDEEAMPPEPPTELGKAADDDEDTLFESRAAMKRLDGGAWADLGKGTARLSEHKTTKQRRVVVRSDAGKVLMNFKIDPKMSFVSKAKAGALTFNAICDGDDRPTTYMLRSKDPLTADLLKPAKFSESP